MTLSPVVAGLIPQFPVTFSPETFLNPPANNRSMKTSISIHQDWQIGAQTVTHDGILTFHDIGALDAQLDEAKIALGEVRSLAAVRNGVGGILGSRSEGLRPERRHLSSAGPAVALLARETRSAG